MSNLPSWPIWQMGQPIYRVAGPSQGSYLGQNFLIFLAHIPPVDPGQVVFLTRVRPLLDQNQPLGPTLGSEKILFWRTFQTKKKIFAPVKNKNFVIHYYVYLFYDSLSTENWIIKLLVSKYLFISWVKCHSQNKRLKISEKKAKIIKKRQKGPRQ